MAGTEIRVESKIYTWKTRPSKMFTEYQKFVFHASFETKWEIAVTYRHQSLCFYWKMLQLPRKKFGLHAAVWVTLLDNFGADYQTIQMEQTVEPYNHSLDIIQEEIMQLCFTGPAHNWGTLTDSRGYVSFRINFELNQLNRRPEKSMDEYYMQFRKVVCGNMSALLNDHETSDLKIVTSDAQELIAHKLILKAQCPVFAAMFRSQFREQATGTVEIQDVSSKTMSILLRYFYTGELLPSWNDEDIILEFTYAVGKYGISELLEMLDDVLGTNYQVEATHQTILLLDLAQKLSLKVAEKTIVERVVQKIDDIETTEALIELFGFSDINEVSQIEGSTMPEFKKVLSLFDNILGDRYDCETSPFVLSLLRISSEMSFANIEEKLLEWLKNRVKKFKTANELFTLFQLGSTVEKNCASKSVRGADQK